MSLLCRVLVVVVVGKYVVFLCEDWAFRPHLSSMSRKDPDGLSWAYLPFTYRKGGMTSQRTPARGWANSAPKTREKIVMVAIRSA